MFKSKLFWLGALLHPRIIANRLCDLSILVIFIVFYACLGNWSIVFVITGILLFLLLLFTISPNKTIQFCSEDGRTINILLFEAEIRRPVFFICDQKTGKSVIRIITTDKNGKNSVCIKSLDIDNYSLHLIKKGFFLAYETGSFCTAYGVNYPKGKEVGFPYPSLTNNSPSMFAYSEADKIVLNLFSNDDIFSIRSDKVINSADSYFWLNPSYATFTLYKTTNSVEQFATNYCITYLLVLEKNCYQLFAYVKFVDCNKLFSVKIPKFSVRYDDKYFDYIYDKDKGYKIFNGD